MLKTSRRDSQFREANLDLEPGLQNIIPALATEAEAPGAIQRFPQLSEPPHGLLCGLPLQALDEEEDEPPPRPRCLRVLGGPHSGSQY